MCQFVIIAAAEPDNLNEESNKMVSDVFNQYERYCYICGKQTRGVWFNGVENAIICAKCKSTMRKRKHPKNVVQHSKPLRVSRANGYAFIFDKMVNKLHKTITFTDGHRIRTSNKVCDRQNRKRQRRVNQFFIQEGLSSYEIS